jgi:hypothetical protein
MNRPEFTSFEATGGSPHARRILAFLGPGRDVALLAGVQIVCFLALTRLEPRFFIIHLYQLIPYAAIVVLIGYGQECWAYMAGPLVSLGWLTLASMAGLLGSAVERLRTFGSFSTDANLVTLLAIFTAAMAVLMTMLCRIHWVKEYSGRGRTWHTFLVSLAIVAAYYTILLRWFWDMIPNA